MKSLLVFFFVILSAIFPDTVLANEEVVQVKISTHFKGEVVKRSAVVGLGDSIKLISSQEGMIVAIEYVIKNIQVNNLKKYSLSATLYSGVEGGETWLSKRDIFAVVEKSVPAFFRLDEASDEMQVEVTIADIQDEEGYLKNMPRKTCDLSLESPIVLKSQSASGTYGCCDIRCQSLNGTCCGAIMCCLRDPDSYPVWQNDIAHDCCCYPPQY